MVGQTLNGGGTDPKQRILLLWGKKSSGQERPGEHLQKETWLLQFDGGIPKWTKVTDSQCIFMHGLLSSVLLSNPSSMQVSIPEEPRSWHVAVAYYPFANSAQSEVMVTGGGKYPSADSELSDYKVPVSDTFTMHFGK